jgi:GcrA cell cycle regulator
MKASAVGEMQVEAMTVNETQATWTTERVALLKEAMDAGLSCAQIAREIGVSRNAVIGKANRLGLSRSRGPRLRSAGAGQVERRVTRKNGHVRTTRQALRSLWAEAQVGLAEAPSENASRRSLFELAQWHCRWPLGDPASDDFGFCGDTSVNGLPYCAAHARMAYRQGTRLPRRHGEQSETGGMICDTGAARENVRPQHAPDVSYAAAVYVGAPR